MQHRTQTWLRRQFIKQGAGAAAVLSFPEIGIGISRGGESSKTMPWNLSSDQFPLGMFSVDNARAMDDIAKMGLNYAHTYATGQGNHSAQIAHDLAYMDMAHERGLKVLFNLQGQRWMAMEHGIDKMRVLVDAVKDHPAFGFWYFFDEPDGKFMSAQLMPFYRALKTATPNVPVAIATAWSKNWYRYNATLDVLMIDTYPVQHKPFPGSDLSVMTRFTNRALALGKPVIPINQCMNWKVLAGSGKTYRGSPVSQLRFPTRAEIRYWCFSGAAQGVRGMFWWSYARSIQAGRRWITGPFAKGIGEFRQFIDLTTPTYQPMLLKQARKNDLLLALWGRPKEMFLVAVNTRPVPRPLDCSLEDHAVEASLEPWGSTRTVDAVIRKGRLTGATARPWEVFVWRVIRRRPS